MAHNAHRGEIELELGGKMRRLVPKFTALAEVEQATGMSLQAAGTMIAMQQANADLYVQVVLAGLRAAGDRDVEYNDVGQWIMDAGGIAAIQDAVTDFFAGIIRFYDADAADAAIAAGKKKAVTKKATKPKRGNPKKKT